MNIPQRTTPAVEDLRHFYVGKDIKDVPHPALILDKGVAHRNCEALLNAVSHLGLGFRAHIKTHKVGIPKD
jgi:D-serine ammonia-lyase